MLGSTPGDIGVDRGSVLHLDASDVRYEVVHLAADGAQEVATVEPFAEPATPAQRLASTPRAERHRLESTGEVQLTLHHLGGSGPPLLICHATGFHGLAYAPLAKGLAPYFDVWAADLRGHGASSAPVSGDFAWQGMADDVARCLGEIGADPPVGVGHSMGGAAILLAEVARPGSFAAAYLFEPIVLPPTTPLRKDNPMSGPARRRRPAFPSKQAAFQRYASRPPLDELRTDALAAYVEHGFVDTGEDEVRLACDPEHEARTFEAEDKMTIDLIRSLSLPLMVAAGGPEGDPNPAAFAPDIVAAVPGAILRPHPELGHFGPLEAPDRIAAEVVDWLT